MIPNSTIRIVPDHLVVDGKNKTIYPSNFSREEVFVLNRTTKQY